MLELDGVSKSFGGIRAVDAVDARFPRGAITGLVGPNGAGKTTIFNLITGVHRPSAGAVRLDGIDITGRKPYAIARGGIGRSFQHTRIFHRLTVAENVVLARGEVSDALGRALAVTRARKREWHDEARRHLAFVGLADKADALGADLSYAEQKLVMFACLMASGARTLLLDEPTAGLDPLSRRAIIDVVARLRHADTAVVLIEHNLDVVRGCCDRVVFLAEGRVVAEGTPAEIERDPQLTRLYFGGGAHA